MQDHGHHRAVHSAGGHGHVEHSHHGHAHAVIDPAITTSERGIWAIKWSFLGLVATALLQTVVVVLSGSVALLADTIHNVGDAATAIPLWIAFAFARRAASQRFSFGFGKVEDLAGVTIVATILFSALVAGYAAVDRLLHPQPVQYLGVVAAAALIGFLGNEAVAIFRIRVGNEIRSAALVADGYHARIDGWTSLAVLLSAGGVWLGYPIADPIVGMVITAVILGIVWQSAKAVFLRILDGVEPDVIDEVRHSAAHVPGVLEVTEVRVRWIGHRLAIEANVTVDSDLSVREGHEIATQVRHELLHHLTYLSWASIHVDPLGRAGEAHHQLSEHTHDGLPLHVH